MKTLLALTALATLAPISAFAGTSGGDFNSDVVTVPEPATLGLMAIGVAGAVIASRFRKKK